jgi:hypothetical protein
VVGGVPGIPAWPLPALLPGGHTAVSRGGRGLTATVTATAADKFEARELGVPPRVHRWIRTDGRRHDADVGRLMGSRRRPWAGAEDRRLGASHEGAGRLRASAGHRGRRRSGVRVPDACAWTGGGRAPTARDRYGGPRTSACTRACGLTTWDWSKASGGAP